MSIETHEIWMKLRNQTAELSGSGETWVSLNRQVMRSFQQNSLLEGSGDLVAPAGERQKRWPVIVTGFMAPFIISEATPNTPVYSQVQHVPRARRLRQPFEVMARVGLMTSSHEGPPLSGSSLQCKLTSVFLKKLAEKPKVLFCGVAQSAVYVGVVRKQCLPGGVVSIACIVGFLHCTVLNNPTRDIFANEHRIVKLQ
jgi:hypothetical protein